MHKHSKNIHKNISYGIIYIIYYVYKKKILLIFQGYNFKLMIKLKIKM